jgi:hypothetical protein
MTAGTCGGERSWWAAGQEEATGTGTSGWADGAGKAIGWSRRRRRRRRRRRIWWRKGRRT